MHRLTATDTPMVRYTRTIFPSYAATKIRNIFYCDWNRKIYLCDVSKTQTKVSLAIGFFILTKRKSTS